MEQMLNYVISFVNQHSKYFDMLCYNQVKNCQDSIGIMEGEHRKKYLEMEQ